MSPRRSFTVLAVLCALACGPGLARALAAAPEASPPAGAAPTPHWPSLAEQLRGVTPGSALDRLIHQNQDFSPLRPEEATDDPGLPPWLRVFWRHAHPEIVYSADGATGGYPLILHEIGEWMLTHQDLLPGNRVPDTPPSRNSPISASSNFRISGLQTTTRSESDIRVNYRDPNKIIAAANDIETGGRQAQYYSTDGGATWGQTSLSLATGDTFQGDPAVDWTSDGTAWATTLGIHFLDPAHMVTNPLVRAYKSTDFGATWSFDGTVSGTQTTTDKPMLWADHAASSPYKDNLYVIWINSANAAVYVGTRAPGPSGTWSSPLRIDLGSGFNGNPGADVKTNGAGDVFAFWPGFDPVAFPADQRILLNKSTDGGLTFSPVVTVAHTFARYRFGIPAQATRPILIYVSAAAFRTPTQSFVYATWEDLTGDAGCTTTTNAPGTNVASTCKTRIWFTRSTDGGATWAAPIRVNDPPSLNDQFFPHLVVDEVTGALSLTYYDTVNDPGRKKTDVWYQSSFDNGATWSAAIRVTTAPTDETVAGADSFNQYGDYTGLSGYSGKFFPSWTDRRNNLREEIWSAIVADGCPGCGEAASFVSITGNDGNDCSRLTPCQTFAGALARTPAGGEIDILDSGDFGPVTITQSVSLVAARALGGIQLGAGTAITINAGPTDKVVLRGLTLDGLGTAANGITFNAGGFLYVENCTINDFGGYGIEFAPTSGSGRLFVLDTTLRNNGVGTTGGGLHLLANTGPGFVATVDGLRTENNVFGVKAENLGIVTLRHSVAANNGFTGFSAVNASGSGTLRMVIEDSVSTHNGTNGVLTSGLATVALSNTVVTDNATGLNGAGGAISSFHNNRVWGNLLDESGTILPVTDR